MWHTLLDVNTGVTALTGTGIIGGFAWIIKLVKSDRVARAAKLSALQDNDKLQHAAMVAMLHHEIYELCNMHLNRGYISTDDLDDLTYLYNSYHALHGNGTGKILYEKVCALPNQLEKMEA